MEKPQKTDRAPQQAEALKHEDSKEPAHQFFLARTRSGHAMIMRVPHPIPTSTQPRE